MRFFGKNKVRRLSDRFDPSTAVFPSLDVDLIAKDLNLEKKGRDRGARGLPRTEDGGLDSIEHAAIGVVEQLRRKGLENYEAHIRVYSDRLTRAGESRVEIKTVAGNAETDFAATLKVWDNHIANERSAVALSGQALVRFRERNLLDRPADKGTGFAKFFGLLSMIFVIESILNGLLFREASTQGILGGIVIAVSISAVNVLTATLSGRALRYVNHVSWLWKTLGLVGAGLLATLVVGINLAAAHFRDVATTGLEMEAAATVALEQFLADPVALSSLQSWLLFALGLLIAFFAGLKAYQIDDAYPGYGDVWFGVIRARQAYSDVLEQAIEKITEARDEAVERLREESGKARHRLNEAVDALYGRSSVIGQLGPFLEQCDLAANRLLSIYRDANRAARSTPPPRHFGQPFRFERMQPITADPKERRSADEARAEIKDMVDQAIEVIFETAKTAIASYANIDDLEDQTAFGAAHKARREVPKASWQPAVERLSVVAGGRERV